MGALNSCGFFGLQENKSVAAYCLETNELVGVFPSIKKAASSLFIRSAASISGNILRNSGKNKPSGIKSKKTGNKYYFRVVS